MSISGQTIAHFVLAVTIGAAGLTFGTLIVTLWAFARAGGLSDSHATAMQRAAGIGNGDNGEAVTQHGCSDTLRPSPSETGNARRLSAYGQGSAE
jgi:hypothetical protein